MASTFRPMPQSPLQILAQPQSNDALMASILAQGATSQPSNVPDALGKLLLLYSANKMNTRANESDMAKQQAAAAIAGEALGGAPDANTAAQASVIANPASIPPQQPESASVVPVERSPLAPPMGNAANNMAGAMPPDGGPAIGSLTMEAPGPNDVVPSQPYRVADAMPPQGHAMAVPGFQNIDGQLQSNMARLRQLQEAQGILAGSGVSDPRIDAEIKRLDAANKELESRRGDVFKEAGTQSRHMDDLTIKQGNLAINQAAEARQQAKADREIQTEQRALQKQQEMRELTGDIVTTDIDRALTMLNDDSNVIPETGALGGFASNWMPGTDAFDIGELLKTVKANAGFDKLQQMREASPTGGALGQVSEQEIAFLQAAIGNLSQYQSKGQLQDNMKRVKNIYLDIIHGKGNGPEREELSFDRKTPALPKGVTEADIEHTMQIHGLTRQQVLERLQ